MLPLLNAIYTRFTTTGTLTAAFPAGLFRDRAPEATALPYVVSHVVQSKLEYSYAGACRSDTQIKFSAYGVGHDATGTLMNALTAAFDDALLTLSNGTNDTVTRLSEPIPVLHKHDAMGNDVWEWGVVYEYSVTV
jgi:hypothetical protein